MIKHTGVVAVLIFLLVIGSGSDAGAERDFKLSFEPDSGDLIKLMHTDKIPTKSMKLFKIKSKRGHYLPKGTNLSWTIFKIDPLVRVKEEQISREGVFECGENGEFEKTIIIQGKQYTAKLSPGYFYRLVVKVSHYQKKDLATTLESVMGKLKLGIIFPIGTVSELGKRALHDGELWLNSIEIWDKLVDTGKSFADDSAGMDEARLAALCKAFRKELERLRKKEFGKNIEDKLKVPKDFFVNTRITLGNFLNSVDTCADFIARPKVEQDMYPHFPNLDFRSSYFKYLQFRITFMYDFVCAFTTQYKGLMDNILRLEDFHKNLWGNVTKTWCEAVEPLKKIVAVFGTGVMSDGVVKAFKKHRILAFKAKFGSADDLMVKVKKIESYFESKEGTEGEDEFETEGYRSVIKLLNRAVSHLETVMKTVEAKAVLSAGAETDEGYIAPRDFLSDEIKEKSGKISIKLSEELNAFIEAQAFKLGR